jgi:uncharacterized membrane protein
MDPPLAADNGIMAQEDTKRKRRLEGLQPPFGSKILVSMEWSICVLVLEIAPAAPFGQMRPEVEVTRMG